VVVEREGARRPSLNGDRLVQSRLGQGEPIDRGGGLDSRQGPQPREHPFEEGALLARLRVLPLREAEDQGQHAMGIAAGSVTLEDPETLDPQRLAEQGDERQRDLGDHQRAAGAAAADRRIGPPRWPTQSAVTTR
jgi:hypothetical protein